MERIVEFDKYCSRCEHKGKAENEDPCWDCLAAPVNEDSKKPINFKESK